MKDEPEYKDIPPTDVQIDSWLGEIRNKENRSIGLPRIHMSISFSDGSYLLQNELHMTDSTISRDEVIKLIRKYWRRGK